MWKTGAICSHRTVEGEKRRSKDTKSTDSIFMVTLQVLGPEQFGSGGARFLFGQKKYVSRVPDGSLSLDLFNIRQ